MENVESNAATRQRVWDLPVRVFHWALVAAFVGAYVLSEQDPLRHIHVMFGYTVLGLVAFRLLWGFVGTRHARFASFLYGPRAAIEYAAGMLRGRTRSYAGHNPLGSWSIWLMLALAAGVGSTGWLMVNQPGGERWEDIHEALANAWLAVILVHVAGVVVSGLLQRQNLAKAMVTGYKRVKDGAAAVAAPGGVPVRATIGAAVALAVLGFWAFWASTGFGERTLQASAWAAAEGASAESEMGEYERESDD